MMLVRFVVGLCLGMVSLAASANPIFEFHPVIKITGNQLCLDQLGVLYQEKEAQLDITDWCVSTERLSTKTKQRRISRVELEKLFHFGEKNIAVAGPSVVRILWQDELSDQAPETAAMQWLTNYLAGRYEQFYVAPINRRALSISAETKEWRVREKPLRPRREECLWVDGFHGQRLTESHPVCFSLSAYRYVKVISEQSQRGDEVSSQRIEEQLVDVTRLDATPAQLVDGVDYLFTQPVSVGQVLTQHHITKKPPVVGGAGVKVISQVGSVKIVAQGVAMDDGELGDRVRVRLTPETDLFSAEVIDQGVVVVKRDA